MRIRRDLRMDHSRHVVVAAFVSAGAPSNTGIEGGRVPVEGASRRGATICCVLTSLTEVNAQRTLRDGCRQPPPSMPVLTFADVAYLAGTHPYP